MAAPVMVPESRTVWAVAPDRGSGGFAVGMACPGGWRMRVLTSMWLVPALFALLTLTALLMDRTLVHPLQRLAMGRSHGPRPEARAVHVRASATPPLHGDDARGGVDGDDVP